MDEIDLKILEDLKVDARIPFLQIAKKLGISPKTVNARYKKMVKKGAILPSTISIDLSKIGYEGKAYLMITNAPNHDANMTIKALNQMQDIVLVSEIVGDFDVLAIGLLRSVKGFAKLLQDVKALPSVGCIDFAIVTDTQFPVDKSYDSIPLRLAKRDSKTFI